MCFEQRNTTVLSLTIKPTTYLKQTMNYSTFIAPVLALMSAIQPVSAVTQVPEGYRYIATAHDQEMYFGKVVARSGDVAFMQVFTLEQSGEQGGWLAQG